jgi:hypothetical protein
MAKTKRITKTKRNSKRKTMKGGVDNKTIQQKASNYVTNLFDNALNKNPLFEKAPLATPRELSNSIVNHTRTKRPSSKEKKYSKKISPVRNQEDDTDYENRPNTKTGNRPNSKTGNRPTTPR